ncbi:MAG TPA: hypothetical protein VFX50_15625, partial [Gemmatimonadales bacterium]|nr:hypothetical protein [Gemmatimonadales bacterium]
GPWLSDLRTQLVYGTGNFAERVVPAFTWWLLTEAGLQGPWPAEPGLPVGLASDAGIAAYADGVLTLAAQWCYVPSGRVLGFAP